MSDPSPMIGGSESQLVVAVTVDAKEMFFQVARVLPDEIGADQLEM